MIDFFSPGERLTTINIIYDIEPFRFRYIIRMYCINEHLTQTLMYHLFRQKLD